MLQNVVQHKVEKNRTFEKDYLVIRTNYEYGETKSILYDVQLRKLNNTRFIINTMAIAVIKR